MGAHSFASVKRTSSSAFAVLASISYVESFASTLQTPEQQPEQMSQQNKLGHFQLQHSHRNLHSDCWPLLPKILLTLVPSTYSQNNVSITHLVHFLSR